MTADQALRKLVRALRQECRQTIGRFRAAVEAEMGCPWDEYEWGEFVRLASRDGWTDGQVEVAMLAGELRLAERIIERFDESIGEGGQ